jgi:hypothetical protein
MRGDFPWLRPVRPHFRPSLRGGRGPHAHVVRGRIISSTKVKALPEWLGQCKLLETLCVRTRRLHAMRVRCGALLRRALGPSRAALDAAAAALPVVGRRPSRARAWLASRPTGARSGWAGAARRGRTVGAQGRGQHRARGAAGGGRLAKPEGAVSAPAAALTLALPMRRRVAGG